MSVVVCSSSDDTKKRDRKVNFTDEELRRLLACYKEQKLKNGLWAKIASQVSATGVAVRSTVEVKKKWSDIKRAALKHASETKYPKTGGRPPVHKPWFVDAVLGILGDETSLIEGIQGALLLNRYLASIASSSCSSHGFVRSRNTRSFLIRRRSASTPICRTNRAAIL